MKTGVLREIFFRKLRELNGLHFCPSENTICRNMESRNLKTSSEDDQSCEKYILEAYENHIT